MKKRVSLSRCTEPGHGCPESNSPGKVGLRRADEFGLRCPRVVGEALGPPANVGREAGHVRMTASWREGQAPPLRRGRTSALLVVVPAAVDPPAHELVDG